jgi:hypothetical protein
MHALPFFPLIFDPNATVDSLSDAAKSFQKSMLSMPQEAFQLSQEQTVNRLVKTANERDAVLQDSLASDRATIANACFELMTYDLRKDLG